MEFDLKEERYICVIYTYENRCDAKSFVGEDDGAVGVAEGRCEIDAVIPRTYLYHSYTSETSASLPDTCYLYYRTSMMTAVMKILKKPQSSPVQTVIT